MSHTPIAAILLATSVAVAGPVTLDGSFDDWGEEAMQTDGRYLYLRYAPGGKPTTLQSSPILTRIMLDLDADPGTGHDSVSVIARKKVGIDLEIQLSPPAESGPGRGVSVYTYDKDGHRAPASHASVDFSFAPTYAAPLYELRIDPRTVRPDTPSHAGATAIVMRIDAEGRPVGELQRLELAPGPIPGEPAPAEALPEKPEGALRVMSFNVWRTRPARKPDQFVRLFKAIRPDVILTQEWDDYDAPTLASWFNEHAPLPDAGLWQAVANPDAGVAIITRHDVLHTLDAPVKRPGARWPVRVISAIVDAPIGQILVSSVHLKCCGSVGSPEDAIRLEETRAINAHTRDLLRDRPVPLRVIAGDMNLVGSRPPLDVLREGLDADGTALDVAEPRVLADRARYTWTDPGSEFGPGRLDYMLVSDSTARVANAFIVDTARLSDDALEKSGLERADSAVSDHRPIVVDLVAPEKPQRPD